MLERDVVAALTEKLATRHRHQPGTLIIEELGIGNGHVIADMAVVNGCMSGYEIKTDRDTLQRLPRQVEAYSKALDFASIVVGSVHAQKAVSLIPDWWGVVVAEWDGARVSLNEIRTQSPNPSPDPATVVTFLWRDEAWSVLKRTGWSRGYSGKTVRNLYRRICEVLTLDEIRAEVRTALKSRPLWKVDGVRLKH